MQESFDDLSKAVAKMIVDRIRIKPALVRAHITPPLRR